MFIGGTVCLLGVAPIGDALGTSEFFRWFVANIYGTNVKIFDLLGTIGSLLLVFRSLFGLERGFMSAPEVTLEEATRAEEG
jgi:hypothetical protein